MTEFTISKGIPDLGITVKNDKSYVSSRELALAFDKRHADVMRDIKDRVIPYISDDFNQRNFTPVKYKDKKGESRPEYLLTFDGFSIVAMGYTGKRAMEFKEAYIQAFNAMKDLITTRILSKEGYKEMTDAIKDYIANDWREYAKEANMINNIVLGMTSKESREVHGLKKNESIRDSAVTEKLTELDKAQRLNGQLISANILHEERIDIISKNFRTPF